MEGGAYLLDCRRRLAGDGVLEALMSALVSSSRELKGRFRGPRVPGDRNLVKGVSGDRTGDSLMAVALY